MTNTRTSKTVPSKSISKGAVKKVQSARSAAIVKAKPRATGPVVAATAPALKARRSAAMVKTKPVASDAAPNTPALKTRRSTAPKTSVKPVVAVSERAKAGAAEPVNPPKAPKLQKAKLVRHKFTMHEQEYQILFDLKQAFKDSGTTVKRSELVRVAVSLLTSHDLPTLQALVARLPARKPGLAKQVKPG